MFLVETIEGHITINISEDCILDYVDFWILQIIENGEKLT